MDHTPKPPLIFSAERSPLESELRSPPRTGAYGVPVRRLPREASAPASRAKRTISSGMTAWAVAARSRLSLGHAAFTLTELLAVILIILVLVGLVISISSSSNTRSANNRARAEIAAMVMALESLKTDTGSYPSMANSADLTIMNVYNALDGGGGKYLKFDPNQLFGSMILDPFGRYYHYRVPGFHNPASFDLWSNGKDGKYGTDDDIGNWN